MNFVRKTKKLIKDLAKTLLLTFVLIILSLVFDFLVSLSFSDITNIVINTIKYSMLIYPFICQIDILIAFIIIVKN